MSAETLLTSDIVGLTKTRSRLAPRLHDRVGRRRRRLHARRRPGARRGHHDRHRRPDGRRRQGQGRRTARCRSISRGRPRCSQSARHPGGDGDLRPARIHQGRDAPPRQARRVRGRAGLLFPQGRRSHQDHRDAAADADRERQAGRRAARRSRRHGGVGEVAGRRHRAARHHRLLPRRPHGLGICRPQPGAQGRRRVLRLAGRSDAQRRSGRRARPSLRPR